MRRTIKFAVSANETPITHSRLANAEYDTWMKWRNDITTNRHFKCGACGNEVYITIKDGEKIKSAPYFQHYSLDNTKQTQIKCIWSDGNKKTHQNEFRKEYNGALESPLHKGLCELIAYCSELDKDVKQAPINKYHKPENIEKNKHGKRPDILLEFNKDAKFSKFAIELQISNTFQTEITERERYYNNEKIPFIWIFDGLYFEFKKPKQNFMDIIHRQKGCAYLVDEETIEQSEKHKKLILKCFTFTNGVMNNGYNYISLYDLITPFTGLAYYKNSLFLNDFNSFNLIEFLEKRNEMENNVNSIEAQILFRREQHIIFQMLNKLILDIFEGERKYLIDDTDQDTFFYFLATLLTVRSEVDNKFKNYFGKNINITSFINSKTQRNDFRPFIATLEKFIIYHQLKLNESVYKHLNNAKEKSLSNNSQIKQNDLAILNASKLFFPELLIIENEDNLN